jgi:uncharacterized membrane protein (DUF4010 family)
MAGAFEPLYWAIVIVFVCIIAYVGYIAVKQWKLERAVEKLKKLK